MANRLSFASLDFAAKKKRTKRDVFLAEMAAVVSLFIDVHRRKAALVMMRVPERKLLAAMRRTECVVDVEHLQLARLNRHAKLINQRRTKPRRLGFTRRILQREMVDCDASGAPVCGQRPTATFSRGSCRSRSRSIASS